MPRTTRIPWREIAVWTIVWTAIAALRSLQAVAALAYAHQAIDWGRVCGERFLEWYAVGALTPFYVVLVRRTMRAELPLAANVPIYAFAIVAGLVLYDAIYVLLGDALLHEGVSFTDTLVNQAFSDIFGLSAIFLAILATEHYRIARERERRSIRLEAELAQAHLHSLRAQLNPHFLFNTLNSVCALMLHDTAGAQEMLVRLSAMLRLTLDAGAMQEVPLRDELEILKRYFEIQHVRFGDRLTTHVRVAAGLLDERVPSFILQPLVENSIRHGMSPTARHTTIDVTGIADRHTLTLSVADDGDGLKPTEQRREGIGLGNTRRRLRTLYGDTAALAVEGRTEGGTLVTVSIPRREIAGPP